MKERAKKFQASLPPYSPEDAIREMKARGQYQNHWLASLEQFGGGRKNAISNRSRCIPFHFRYIFKWNGIVQKVAQSNVLGTSAFNSFDMGRKKARRITPKKCANYRLEPIKYRYLSIFDA